MSCSDRLGRLLVDSRDERVGDTVLHREAPVLAAFSARVPQRVVAGGLDVKPAR
jgi:hypothetical protein